MTENAAPLPYASTEPAREPRLHRARLIDGAVVLLCILGWWLSLDLLRMSYGLRASNPALSALCDPATPAAGDCQSVLTSSWGSVPLSPNPAAARLPLAVFGMGYFAAVGLWFLFAGSPGPRRWYWHLPIAAVVVLGAWQSLAAMYVMGVTLNRWCAGCVAVHVANFAILLLTLIGFPWRRSTRRPKDHPSAALALASLVAAVLALAIQPLGALFAITSNAGAQYRSEYEKIAGDLAYIRWNHARQTPVAIPVEADVRLIGEPAAAHTAVAFVDFECSSCRELCDKVDKAMARNPGKLRVAYRHFPLDRACNPNSQRTVHPSACAAARAFEAVAAVGDAQAVTRMRLLLYARQSQLAADRYAEWAEQIGLDRAAFVQALNSPGVNDRIAADVALGSRLGVSAAPTLFLDGRRFDGWRRDEAWDALLGLDPSQAPDR